jgi:PAS domain S-box-containing protein
MTPAETLPTQESHGEIVALIETLRVTENRLDELTAGAVDSVVDQEGSAFMLRRAQERARARETSKQAAILDGLPAHIALLDSHGQIVSVNEAWREFGSVRAIQSPGYGVGLNYLDICDEAVGHDTAGAREVAEGIRSVLCGTVKSFSLEYACHSPTTQGWFLLRVTPLRGHAIGGAVVMHVDITERKLAEVERSGERKMLRTLIDALPDIVYTMDANGCFVVCNPAALASCGVTRQDELVGRSVFDIFEAEEAERFHADDLRVLAGHAVWTREERSHDRANATKWYLTTKVPLRDENEVIIGIVGISRDITELKRDQQALRELNLQLEARVTARTAELNLARDEAERANRAKSAFIATMSHEIRTPMNGVIGMIDVLHQTSLQGYQVEMVDLIRDSADSLLFIIDDILDLSKIEAGKLTLENEPMLIADEVENICGMLHHVARKRGVQMRIFVDPAIPRTLFGDKTRLRQIIVNLASNAIKFSSGRVAPGQMSVRVVLVERKAHAVTLDVIVADNGIGINDATLARLFQPFAQADASTTRRFGGTGLGLAICSMLVKLMGGTISVSSEPDEGSTFTVRVAFPSCDNAEEDERKPAIGMCCRIVGAEQPLATDLGAYLLHAGARVEWSPDLVRAEAAEPSGDLQVWLILPELHPPAVAELRAIAARTRAASPRFVILGRGKRRRPRAEALDLVFIDADVLLRRTLLKAVGLAARGSLEDVLNDDLKPSISEDLGRLHHETRLVGELILVAEDNETNRKVISQQLRLLGFAAEVVADGRAALERWRKGEFALVLTDLHMPEMDGYALAAAIRSEEVIGARRTPIVALTANVLRDEESRCLAAGMDAYISKPIRLPQLNETISRLLAARGGMNAAPTHRTGLAVVPPMDLAVLEALVGSDASVIDEVLRAFRRSIGEQRQELLSASSAKSLQAIMNAAHKLKSGARSVGADQLGAICGEIEHAVATGRSDAFSDLMGRLQVECTALELFLDSR